MVKALLFLNSRFSDLLEPGINFPAAENFQHTLTSRRKKEETKQAKWLEECRNWDKRLSNNYVFIRFVKAAGLFWRVLGNGWPVNIKKKREKRSHKCKSKQCKQVHKQMLQTNEKNKGTKLRKRLWRKTNGPAASVSTGPVSAASAMLGLPSS